MKNMTLKNVAEACGGYLHPCNTKIYEEIKGITIDSRKIQEDYLFIATKGERVDGHDFIDMVIDKGAIAVICEKEPSSKEIPYILVKDSFCALKDIAEFYRMQLKIPMIGITGSVGKTSTKEMVAAVLEQKFKVLKTAGNFNNEVGLPLTILQITREHEAAVLEMGISEFGEMHRLSKIAKPDICVLTNIGLCHLENLKSRDGILQAKSEIFDFISENGEVCCNGDDDKLMTIGKIKGRFPVFFGLAPKNDIYANEILNHGLFGTSCTIHTKKGNISVSIPLPGEHMIYNALAATSVGLSLKLSLAEIQKGIASIQPVNGRSNLIKTKRYTLIDDCYNANPTSMKAAIDLLKTANTRKVAILGDMFELGIHEKEMHRDIGNYVAKAEIEVVICIGNLSFYIYEAIKDNFKNQVHYFETKQEFLSNISMILQPSDTILIKASHGMEFENIVNALQKCH
ncbi:MAG TPA: UDP-N-acetylmuramoyl-tripeptide--D-alanyl-D-alanine ligase [Lachnospiraceae bacterium]|nr:UDP-N-acetylmuramoyl-tripeptide--D-alanyl-D-alanine ligase [Lachnospiraceae bacterium]